MSWSQPIWVDISSAIRMHDTTIIEDGGLPGLKNLGGLESAMAKPLNLFAYGGVDQPSVLCTSYAEGIIQNHPFNDGNKRTALKVCAAFANLNGYVLVSNPANFCLALEAFADVEQPAMDASSLLTFIKQIMVKV